MGDSEVTDSMTYAAAMDREGYAIIAQVLTNNDIGELQSAISTIPETDAVRRKQSVYGVRNLLETCPAVCELATRPEIWRLVTPVLGETAFACRAIFFNKTPDANWVLGYHQDSVISVAERIETPGFIAWGQKAGVWQVQPPAEVMATMLALRIHLDDCGPDNGPLRVLPGSHRHGWVEDDIPAWKRDVPEVICCSPAGGVVAMRPLLLHASSKANKPANRRVIHIEYTTGELPNGLRWGNQHRPN